MPIAAGVLLAIALMWGESRLWRPDSSSEQRFSGDVSQFLEQVSDAIFDGGSVGEVEPASSDSDLASVQVSLGQNCSDECRGIFNASSSTNTKTKVKAVDRPVIAAKRRPIDPAMQRMLRPSGDQLLLLTTEEVFEHGADTLSYPGNALHAPSAEGSKVFSQTPDAHAEFRRHSHRNAGSDGFVD